MSVGNSMLVLTAAQNKASELFQYRGRPLETYLEQWRSGVFSASAEYVLSVIHEYEAMARCEQTPDLALGNLRVVYASQRVTWKGIDVNLTVAEFRVVKLLLDTAGKYVTYRAIYDAIHYSGFVAGSGEAGYCVNVRAMIKRLRRKFQTVDETFDRIENYNSFGYRWLIPGRFPAEELLCVS